MHDAIFKNITDEYMFVLLFDTRLFLVNCQRNFGWVFHYSLFTLWRWQAYSTFEKIAQNDTVIYFYCFLQARELASSAKNWNPIHTWTEKKKDSSLKYQFKINDLSSVKFKYPKLSSIFFSPNRLKHEWLSFLRFCR